MIVFLKAVAYGAVVGVAAGLIIAAVGFFRSHSQAGAGPDEHGYATLAAVLICGVLGGMFGAAAGLGACLKKKFDGSR
jgi:hypothetical protein